MKTEDEKRHMNLELVRKIDRIIKQLWNLETSQLNYRHSTAIETARRLLGTVADENSDNIYRILKSACNGMSGEQMREAWPKNPQPKAKPKTTPPAKSVNLFKIPKTKTDR
jgi:hypothetical protein